MEELQRIDIYSALNKPNLIFGADRELILMVGVISFALIFTGATLLTSIIGIFLFFLQHAFKINGKKRSAYETNIFAPN